MNTSDLIPLADIKADLRIDTDDDDMLVSAKLEAARRHVEAWCGPLEAFTGSVPGDLVEAIRLLTGHLYNNREATYAGQGEVTEIPLGFHDLIGPYRKWEF
ncbi:head-tail connector protein [Ancylobacter sp. G4_0304]|uniref:head-tail connector protein n=1 Tax=Ancylobacter sp. G4_0304 TaxID=3114289 RepID=UPI0039C64659